MGWDAMTDEEKEAVKADAEAKKAKWDAMSEEEREAAMAKKKGEKEGRPAGDKEGRRLAQSNGWERLQNHFVPATAAVTADELTWWLIKNQNVVCEVYNK